MTDAAIDALVAGLTTRGMDHGISPDFARHLLEVLDDAGFAVVKLPEPSGVRTDSDTGTRRAMFGLVRASVYPGGTWLLADRTSTWTDDEDPAVTAAALLAGTRWAQREAVS